jgi:hypothetical protein
VSILSHECGRNKGRHWQSSLCQCKATYSGMLPGFPEAPLGHITHVPFTSSAQIRQATHDTLGLGSWSTVSYLFGDTCHTDRSPAICHPPTCPVATQASGSPVITIRTRSLTSSNSTFCPHRVFMCFVCICELGAIISIYSLKWFF